ncbi:SPFH domain, Band 7 family protein [Candidatus Electrothrix aarhusensis]|jgi:regulator of protease activity HflC (stomatin/prohibitin superfamily)|uniref:SPFH domain, Band 7 family protein n=1 Tax=Candidatus Electrothrix aarhusensis TaxID=1859131 RepID=A0A3S3SNM6_9BACT|nr:SPFH domain, Band 7 family protein [Candidatus Electrothrix aarhusensis]
MELLFGVIVFVVFIVVILLKTAIVVPQRHEYVVERLGKYRTTLEAGFHVLWPFFDKIAYKRNLKEFPVDIGGQTCITADNVTLEVDGIMYIQVVNSRQSAYGIDDYHFAASQLAQTSLRSAIGKISLDNTFEARENLNQQVVEAIDDAAQNWGIKVLRYEIKDIQPPRSVLDAMEKQMQAEREKRAEIARSEGDKQSVINRAEGERAEAIAKSEGEKMKRINEAEGRAQEILKVAEATAAGIRKVGEALASPGGHEAARLEVAKKYIDEFGKLAKENNTMIVPGNLTDVSGMVATAMATMQQVGKKPVVRPPKA